MKRGTIVLGFLFILVTGCSSGSALETSSTLTIAPPQNPYQAKTQAPITSTPTTATPTVEPLIPTPTPITHIIQGGDTLYGIAIQYNITLDQLVLANPGVDTSALTIGTELIIPQTEEGSLTAPTPTPYPLQQEQPICYPTEDSGMWCFLLVKNDQDVPLENISIAFNIYSDNQELIESVIAFPPLNTLFPDQSIPVGAYIESPPSDQFPITATLLTAFKSEEVESPAMITDYAIIYSQDNRIAEVSGTYQLTNPDLTADQVWIAGIALSEGVPVGIRKWISTENLEYENLYSFNIQIYSLGPGIDQVQLLIELH